MSLLPFALPGLRNFLSLFIKSNKLFFFYFSFQGMVFDLEKHSTLYIDLAKSNPKSKRSRTGKW